ncbi:MAG TPA: hypothetical protein VFS28_00300 [Gemmatimonadales bacterium]|jgi:hypothetical protein|nr:hypothetical protein [Gemmatimonadales bacterium]
MPATLAALAVLGVGYVLAYLLYDRLRDRFGYVGGAEYVLLGLFLGPSGSGVLSAGAVRDLTPLVSLALGWMGMLLGTQFRVSRLTLLAPSWVAIAFTEAATTFATAWGALVVALHYGAAMPWPTAALPAAALAAIATVGVPAAVDALAQRGFGGHPFLPVLRFTARADALVGVVAFGLALAVGHLGAVQPGVRAPTATEWAVINLAVGMASGVLFHLFLGPRDDLGDPAGDDSRLFVSLAGAIVVASGAAYYLNLSPIYTNLVLGLVLANTGSAHDRVTRLLSATERPVYLALLIFAGAAWRPDHLELLWVAVAFVGIRLGARFVGGRAAGTSSREPVLRAPAMWRGLLAQGGLGVALAVNYTQVDGAPLPEVVLTAALISILLFEWVSAAESARALEPLGAPAGKGA